MGLTRSKGEGKGEEQMPLDVRAAQSLARCRSWVKMSRCLLHKVVWADESWSKGECGVRKQLHYTRTRSFLLSHTSKKDALTRTRHTLMTVGNPSLVVCGCNLLTVSFTRLTRELSAQYRLAALTISIRLAHFPFSMHAHGQIYACLHILCQ